METLFGSDSSNHSGSDDENRSAGPNEEMPSTQTQMKDLFGDSDQSKDSSDSMYTIPLSRIGIQLYFYLFFNRPINQYLNF